MKKNFPILILIVLFLFSCSKLAKDENYAGGTSNEVTDALEYYDETSIVNDDNYYPESDDLEKKNIPTETKENKKIPPNEPEELDITKIPKKIIKTGNISCEVEKYKETKERINKVVKKWDGTISNENEATNDWSITNTIIIRVPVEKFDSLVSELIIGVKSVESKQISAVDVTEEFVDVYARLQNKKKEEEQYLEVLKKAYTIDDILKVNNYIYSVREEIEAKEGRLKFLTNQSSFSTINLFIHQDFEEKTNFAFFTKIKQGFEAGWYGLLSFLIGLTYIWPIIIVRILIPLFIILKIRKNKKKKNKKIKN